MPSDIAFKDFYANQTSWVKESEFYDSDYPTFAIWVRINREASGRGLLTEGYPNMFKLRSRRREITQEEVEKKLGEIEKELGHKIEIVNK